MTGDATKSHEVPIAMLFAASVRRAITILIFQLWIAGCSEEPPAPDVEFFAADAHFLVAGYRIVVPIVALQRPGEAFTVGHKLANDRGEILKTKAADPNNPMRVDSVALVVHEYRHASERTEFAKICPLLRRRWAQMACRGNYNEPLRQLPLKFNLFDRQTLERLKGRRTVGGETQYDQVKDMTLRLGVPEIGCDKASNFCTSAVETVPGMIAVWTVWHDEKTGETPAQMSNRQGAALVEFVRRAIGPAEDITYVTTD